MQAFDYHAARSIDEVSSLISDASREVRILSGGTDLLVQLRENRQRADLLVDVKKVPELVGVVYDPSHGLHIGAAASCAQICQNAEVQAHYPGLVDAIGLIGGVQIQNRASVGGNLCNASPAADAIPALIVHAAVCQIRSLQGSRNVPVEQFCIAPGKTCLKPGEFLAWIDVPAPRPRFGAHYLRFIPRNEMDIAIAGAGAAVTLREDHQQIQRARLALAAVAPTPLFVIEAGDFLAGKEITAAVIREAANIAQSAARPIDDLRGTHAQRQQLVAVLARRAIEKAIERARS